MEWELSKCTIYTPALHTSLFYSMTTNYLIQFTSQISESNVADPTSLEENAAPGLSF